MIRMFAAGAIILGIFIAGAASSIALAGSVNGGTGHVGIAQAYVYLKSSPAVKTMTDTAGTFQLTGNIAEARPRIAFCQTIPYVNNNRIVFNTVQAGMNGAFELITISGARISLIRYKKLAAGRHSIPLPKAAMGVYFIRLSTGNTTFLMKAVLGMIMESFPVHYSVLSVSTSASPLGKSPSAAFIDSLIIVARNYKNEIIGITGYDQKNIAVSLTASNPWKPSEALVHEKGMVKILAKGRDFEMGRPDPGIFNDTALTAKAEQPVHTVQFSHDFWMDSSEVTQKDYDSLMKATYLNYKGDYVEWSVVFGKGDEYPAYSVYWTDAALYCNARSKRDGLDTVYTYNEMEGTAGKMCFLFQVSIDTSKNGYRLPTEAEWEYACKAGGDHDYYWGKNYGSYPAQADDSTEFNTFAVWSGNAWNLDLKANKVCRKIPNDYGLYDMAGNVYEWCTDYFEYFTYGSVLDPAAVTGDRLGAPAYMTAKGGSYASAAVFLRAGSRYWYNDVQTMGYWYKFMGIRVVRPIKG